MNFFKESNVGKGHWNPLTLLNFTLLTLYLRCRHDQISCRVNPVCRLHSVGASNPGHSWVTILGRLIDWLDAVNFTKEIILIAVVNIMLLSKNCELIVLVWFQGKPKFTCDKQLYINVTKWPIA